MLAPVRLTGNEFKPPKQHSNSSLREGEKKENHVWLFITVSLHLAEFDRLRGNSQRTGDESDWGISQAGLNAGMYSPLCCPPWSQLNPRWCFEHFDCLLEGTSPAVTPFHTELGLILGHVILLTSWSLGSSHTACTGGHGDLWEQAFVVEHLIRDMFFRPICLTKKFFFFSRYLFVALELSVRLNTPPTGWLSLIVRLFRVYVSKSSCERDQE